MKKLESKHLAGYLPYELKGIMYYGGCVCENVELGLMDIPVWLNCSYPIKPILRPLSDLTKEIEVNGEKFVPFNRIDLSMYELKQLYSNLILPTKLEFWQVDKLLEWHFDIYGLIEKGLAIDINKI